MHPISEILNRLGVVEITGRAIGDSLTPCGGDAWTARSPIDGSMLAEFLLAEPQDVDHAARDATVAFHTWREVPAPVRGHLVRRFGEILREHKADLAAVVTWEAGKIVQESLGEVQEMIDICEFAVGLSRQLHGLTIATERPAHRMMEQWHPLGPVGVISAFNFPVAVWAWNAALALVCGDAVVWKPSEKTPLSALACHSLLLKAARDTGGIPDGLFSVVIGGRNVGQSLAADARLPLISATGSVPMGRAVAQTVAARLGRSLLELGGNNAAIICPSADLDLALRGIVFAAAGTCGQRCTSLRRLFVHESIADNLLQKLRAAYRTLPIGDPLDEDTLVGPLIDAAAGEQMMQALREARDQGGTVFGGEYMTQDVPAGGCYVTPAIVEMSEHSAIMFQETFAPILYVIRYSKLNAAIALQNCVSQGLSSSIFTNDLQEAELFCSTSGSDCGIANVNLGPSGAEIGGAFGGEKDTGGGRESGSDSWKAYMRRATNTINYGSELPLAQGIQFG